MKRNFSRIYRLLSTLFILCASYAQSETDYSKIVEVPFASQMEIEYIKSDEIDDYAYIYDQLHNRFLIFDTNKGYFIRSTVLKDSGRPPSDSPVIPIADKGHTIHSFAISRDRKYLYSSLFESQKIEIYSFPGLEYISKWDYNRRISIIGIDNSSHLLARADSSRVVPHSESTSTHIRIDTNDGTIFYEDNQGYIPFHARISTDGKVLLTSKAEDHHPKLWDLTKTIPSKLNYNIFYPHGAVRPEFDWNSKTLFETVSARNYPFAYDIENLTFLENFAVPAPDQRSTYRRPEAITFNSSANLVCTSFGVFRDNGDLRLFNIKTGELIATTHGIEPLLPVRQFAITPNGKVLYKSTININSNLYHSFAIWGGDKLLTEIPTKDNLAVSDIRLIETGGSQENIDGFPSPGETLHISGTIKNLGIQNVENLSVKLEVSSGPAQINGTGIVNLGRFQEAAAIVFDRLGLIVDETAQPQEDIKINLHFFAQDDFLGTRSNIFKVTKANEIANISSELSPACAIADHSKEIVYISDLRDSRIISLNIETGRIVNQSPIIPRNPTESGMRNSRKMRISPDGKKLYHLARLNNYIQIYDLPDLKPSGVIKLPYRPLDVAVTSDNSLIVSQYHYKDWIDETPGDGLYNKLRIIDPHNGYTTNTSETFDQPDRDFWHYIGQPDLFQDKTGTTIASFDRLNSGQISAFRFGYDEEAKNLSLKEVWNRDSSAIVAGLEWTSLLNTVYHYGEYYDYDTKILIDHVNALYADSKLRVFDMNYNAVVAEYDLDKQPRLDPKELGWRSELPCSVGVPFILSNRGRIVGFGGCNDIWIQNGAKSIEWNPEHPPGIAVEIQGVPACLTGQSIELSSILHFTKSFDESATKVDYEWELISGPENDIFPKEKDSDICRINISIPGEYVIRLKVRYDEREAGYCDWRVKAYDSWPIISLQALENTSDFSGEHPIKFRIETNKELPYLTRLNYKSTRSQNEYDYDSKTFYDNEGVARTLLNGYTFFEPDKHSKVVEFARNTSIFNTRDETAETLSILDGSFYKADESAKMDFIIAGSNFMTFQDWSKKHIPSTDDREYLQDPDSDGFNNYEEYLYGLNPALPDWCNPIKIGSIRIDDVNYDKIEIELSGNVYALRLQQLRISGNTLIEENSIGWSEYIDTTAGHRIYIFLSPSSENNDSPALYRAIVQIPPSNLVW